jgi:hypothetical protein
MSRKLLAALLTFVFGMTAVANDRAIERLKDRDGRITIGGGASVTGEVTTVSGNLITLAGGHVTIDASHAKILHGRGAATIADIEAGALITATLQEPGTVPTAPLVATTIAILRNADVTFTGTIQSVDAAASQFLLLNQAIEVDAETTFVNFGEGASVASLRSNMLVLVEADAAAGALVASRVTLIASIPPRPQLASGVVKSIGTEAWLITVRDRDTTFVVNASTKILGSPKAGDKVEVLYTVDSAHANVALSIIKSFEPPKFVEFTGVVKSITLAQWVITRDRDHADVVVDWPESVRMSPVAGVGDRVVVFAVENPDGTYRAIAILPRR